MKPALGRRDESLLAKDRGFRGVPAIALVVAILLLFPRKPLAAERLESWWTSINDRLRGLSEEARPKPPKAVDVRYRARRIYHAPGIASVLAMTQVRLPGADRDSLVVLTRDRLVVFRVRRGEYALSQQSPLLSPPSSIGSRDIVGTVVAQENAGAIDVLVRTSERRDIERFSLSAGGLQFMGVRASEGGAFPGCDGLQQWKVGRSNFLGPTGAYDSKQCTDSLVDSEGTAFSVVSQVGLNGELRLHCKGSVCEDLWELESAIGYAHLITDLNNDGSPELLSSAASLKGDLALARELAGKDKGKVLFRRSFVGSLEAFAVGDFDGDGHRDWLAAHRGQKGVTFWILN